MEDKKLISTGPESFELVSKELIGARYLKRKTPPTEEERQIARRVVDVMRFSDNALFVTLMKSKPLYSYVLSMIMGRRMVVMGEIKEPRTEHMINLYPHKSVRLDAVATDDSGRIYHIEMENSVLRATPKRARYYASASDIESLEEGDSYEKLTDHYHIFITDGDALGSGETISMYTRKNQNNKELGDGSYMLYVNMRCDSDDGLGRMLRSMMESDLQKIEDKVIRDALSLVREDSDMQISIYDTKVVLDKEREEAIRENSLKEGELREKRKTVIRLFLKGWSLEDIISASDLTGEEIKKIIDEYENAKA